MCSHMSIAAYALPDWEGGSCGPQRFACISSSFFLAGVMFLWRLTVRVDLLAMQVMQSFLRSRSMADASRFGLMAEV